MVCWTWREMSGNGSPIGTAKTIIMLRLLLTPWGQIRVRVACCAEARGDTMRSSWNSWGHPRIGLRPLLTLLSTLLASGAPAHRRANARSPGSEGSAERPKRRLGALPLTEANIQIHETLSSRAGDCRVLRCLSPRLPIPRVRVIEFFSRLPRSAGDLQKHNCSALQLRQLDAACTRLAGGPACRYPIWRRPGRASQRVIE